MNIAAMIDHTLLKQDATEQQIIELCQEAKTYGFASVCVNPMWVETAAQQLKDASSKVCTVIGFPLGAMTKETKAFETKDAIRKGATEIDMVIPVGALKAGQDDIVKEHIEAVVEAAEGTLVKVIIETCLLTDEEKVRACEIAKAAGADYVKTSTGFSTGGATKEDIALMRQTVGKEMGVKASGGVRSLEDVEKMIAAGATRIGASSGVAIVQGEKSNSEY
ncbi:deoxyribose-phosphate aldolase [Savagea sp. SN6]|uniref:Deoxyribose-phosphate aldolase n=1 Tax=Savagea serpentis TaxID=2785297 RepID=A0A8J7GB10_9BACL|nr:deoxyribose-phosphate aldolase [Savagea serpentis]MBF4500166.1 deoxyribose-phosphate aldolase [Savagea serpentis]